MGLKTGGATATSHQEFFDSLQTRLLIEEIRKTDPDKAACLDEGRTDCLDPLNVGWVPIAPGGGPGLASSASRVVPWLARTFGLAGKAATPATITTSAETAATSVLSVSGMASETGILFSITEAASNTRVYLWLTGGLALTGGAIATLWQSGRDEEEGPKQDEPRIPFSDLPVEGNPHPARTDLPTLRIVDRTPDGTLVIIGGKVTIIPDAQASGDIFDILRYHKPEILERSPDGMLRIGIGPDIVFEIDSALDHQIAVPLHPFAPELLNDYVVVTPEPTNEIGFEITPGGTGDFDIDFGDEPTGTAEEGTGRIAEPVPESREESERFVRLLFEEMDRADLEHNKGNE